MLQEFGYKFVYITFNENLSTPHKTFWYIYSYTLWVVDIYFIKINVQYNS